MNWYFLLKCVISGLVVGLVSEIAKKNPGFAAVIASLPLTSILALIWLNRDTGNVKSLIDLSNGIALVVLPSIAFFLIFSGLLRWGWNFWPSLSTSSFAMAIIYFGYVRVLERFGIQI